MNSLPSTGLAGVHITVVVSLACGGKQCTRHRTQWGMASYSARMLSLRPRCDPRGLLARLLGRPPGTFLPAFSCGCELAPAALPSEVTPEPA